MLKLYRYRYQYLLLATEKINNLIKQCNSADKKIHTDRYCNNESYSYPTWPIFFADFVSHDFCRFPPHVKYRLLLYKEEYGKSYYYADNSPLVKERSCTGMKTRVVSSFLSWRTRTLVSCKSYLIRIPPIGSIIIFDFTMMGP